MRGVPQLFGVLTCPVNPDTKTLYACSPHRAECLARKPLTVLSSDEIRRDCARVGSEKVGDRLESRAVTEPQGLVGAQLPYRRDGPQFKIRGGGSVCEQIGHNVRRSRNCINIQQIRAFCHPRGRKRSGGAADLAGNDKGKSKRPTAGIILLRLPPAAARGESVIARRIGPRCLPTGDCRSRISTGLAYGADAGLRPRRRMRRLAGTRRARIGACGRRRAARETWRGA